MEEQLGFRPGGEAAIVNRHKLSVMDWPADRPNAQDRTFWPFLQRWPAGDLVERRRLVVDVAETP